MLEIIQKIQNIDPNKRAIHIHEGMEHKLAKCAKYYSYRSIEIFGSSEFTKKNDYNKRVFLDIGKQMLEISYILNLGQLL
jgi:hypothetical protein